jgi:hypothetical protein
MSCKDAERDEINEPIYTPTEEIEIEAPELEEPVQEYSMSSLIVMVEEGTTEEQIQELCNAYNLEVMYKYDVISGYALSIKDTINDQQLDSLIESIESYSFVTGVEKDSIIQLDDVEE